MDRRCTKSSRPRRAAVAVALGGLGMMAVGAGYASAESTRIVLDMPVVVAAGHDAAGQSQDLVIHDVNDATEAGVIEAHAGSGAGRGEASVGLVDVVKARARGEGSGGAGQVDMEFTVEDPQNRPEVKTILRFKAVAATRADPPNSNSFKGAQWSVAVGRTDGVPLVLEVHDDLTSTFVSGPQFIGPHLLDASINADSQDGGLCLRHIAMNDVVVSYDVAYQCTNVGIDGVLELTHAPGRYLARSIATAGNYGLAIGDPVWEPHPDFADVVITRHAPPGVPSAPLGDTTPEELLADGIDPTLFVAAGFFDAPLPPGPTATPVGNATPTPVGSTPVPTAVATPAPIGSKKCDAAGADGASIAAARARIDLDCPCDAYDGAKGRKHGDYVSCATATVKALVRGGQLKKSCTKATRKCTTSSTCGSPGFVTCRRTTARGQATCSIKAAPDRCVAPRGGDAQVVSAVTNCCDVGPALEEEPSESVLR